MPDNPIVRDVHEDGARIVVFEDGRTILTIPSSYVTCRTGHTDLHIDTPTILALTSLLSRLGAGE